MWAETGLNALDEYRIRKGLKKLWKEGHRQKKINYTAQDESKWQVDLDGNIVTVRREGAEIPSWGFDVRYA